MSIGENIKKYRKNNKLTLKQLGELVGLSEQAIGQYERGDRNPSLEILIKIAVALDVSVNELMEDKKLESDLGTRILECRKAKNFTIQDLANKSGLSFSYISMIENGLRDNPGYNTLKLLANALDTTIEYLMEGKKLESDLGTRILECRKKKGLTQIQLAQKINKSESTIQKYEANMVRPNIAIIDLLAQVLGTTSQYLTYGIGECQVKDDIALIQEAIDNIEKLILQEGYRDNLDYQKGRLDGLRLAINLLSNKGE